MQKDNTDTPRLRIAVLIRHYSRIGGAERYCVELTERLAEHHEVHVFCQAIETTQHPKIIFHSIPKWVQKPRYINQLLFSWLTYKATQNQFDIIHSHDRVTHANVQTLHVPCVLSRYTEITGFKKFLRYLNTVFSPRMLTYLWLEKLQICTVNHRQIIVVSEFLARNVLQSYPAIKKNIHIAYPGIKIKSTATELVLSRQKQRQLFNMTEDDFVILFVANDYKNKGLPVLLEALSLLNEKNLHLMVAGNDNPDKFTHLVTNLKLTQYVHFIGVCEDMQALYPAADVLVHPTLADTYAMVVLEAMAHAIPVIVSNAHYCGFSEHLAHDEALLINNPTDATEIAQHLKHLLSDSPLGYSLAEKGRKKAAMITWENTLQQTLMAYRKVLGAPLHE